ncbi:MAG: phospholipase D-like domain-containing protein [Gemmatirosa sp.]
MALRPASDARDRLAPREPGERSLLDRAFTRAVGASLVGGNDVRLLRDAAENYPAWLAAIAAAERTVHFESYIIHDDATGARFADALIERARAGVAVRVLYDWLGAVGKSSRRYWHRLREAGVEVRVFNPPHATRPFDWITRDHRKMLTVDGGVAFVTGLCVGRMWEGDAARGIAPWRDTGVALRGPAVADVERAFGRVWAACGPPLPDGVHPHARPAPAGDMAVRVVAGEPWTGGLLRLDQLIAAAARESLWLTDAYFAGTPPYVQALLAAARDGVDVRLLVPGGTDIPVLRPLSRAGYRPLLEAGVRVYEWNGPMLHAKTAVSDGRWARVGSTNLNLASWLGNYELDVVIEDERFAEAMAHSFTTDLANATEIVLEQRLTPVRRLALAPADGRPRPPRDRRRRAARRGHGSVGRAAAGALRLGNAVSAAIVGTRVLGRAEASLFATVAGALLALAVVAVLWPWVVALPIAVAGTWIAIGLFGKAWGLRKPDTAGSGTAGSGEAGSITAGSETAGSETAERGSTRHHSA